MKEREFSEQDRELARAWGARLENEPYLYRYVSLEGERRDWFATLMRESKLFFSAFSTLNDPFDSRAVIDVSSASQDDIGQFVASRITPGPERDAAIENLLRARSDPAVLNPVLADWTDRQGVCCLTLSSDDLLMWSYYASGHKGLCLRFKTRALFDDLGSGPAVLIPVDYRAQYPALPFVTASRLQLVHTLIGTKASQWQHEAEWRLVLRSGEAGLVPFKPSVLDGVIMGCRITDDNAALVRSLTSERKPPVKVLRARTMDREYRLQISEES